MTGPPSVSLNPYRPHRGHYTQFRPSPLSLPAPFSSQVATQPQKCDCVRKPERRRSTPPPLDTEKAHLRSPRTPLNHPPIYTTMVAANTTHRSSGPPPPRQPHSQNSHSRNKNAASTSYPLMPLSASLAAAVGNVVRKLKFEDTDGKPMEKLPFGGPVSMGRAVLRPWVDWFWKMPGALA